MNIFRSRIFTRIFTLLLALQVFNLCVDAPDLHPYGRPDRDLSFNEMNSLAEIVLEKVLKIDNAFPEYPERSNRHESSAPLAHVNFYFQQFSFCVLQEVSGYTADNLFIRREMLPLQHSGDVTTPPPKEFLG
jgi:hypothetical protein